MANIKEKFNMLALRKVLINLAMIGLLAVWVISIQKTNSESVKSVDINIASVEGIKDLVVKKDVYQMMKASSPVDIQNIPLRKLDIADIEARLNSDNRIHNAEVYIDAQQNLRVDVVQRRPILRVKDKRGQDFYLDQEGNYVNKSQYRAVRVPIVTGYLEEYEPGWKKKADNRIKTAYQIGQIIYQDEFLSALIEQIHFERDGRIVFTPKIGDEKIVMRYTEEAEKKLTYNLKQYYKRMAEENSWGEYDELDISYKNQVIGKRSVKP